MTEEQARQIIALLTDIKALLERDKIVFYKETRPWDDRGSLTAIQPAPFYGNILPWLIGCRYS